MLGRWSTSEPLRCSSCSRFSSQARANHAGLASSSVPTPPALHVDVVVVALVAHGQHRIVPHDLCDGLAKRLVVRNGAENLDIALVGREEDPLDAQRGSVAEDPAGETQTLCIAAIQVGRYACVELGREEH